MSLFDVKVAKKRAQIARTQARQAVFAEVNKLVPFAKSARLSTLIYRLEAAAEHHGRLKERVGRPSS
jgi:hypothetical protein